MIEILVTSFPFVLRVIYLRWRGLPITLYNVHRALVIWFALALTVFFAVFYYYPKSYTGLVPFRTVPVVAESGGTVSEILVRGGERVEVGDPLFAVENAAERVAVEIADLSAPSREPVEQKTQFLLFLAAAKQRAGGAWARSTAFTSARRRTSILTQSV